MLILCLSFSKKKQLRMPGSSDFVRSSALPGFSRVLNLNSSVWRFIQLANKDLASNLLGLVVTLCFYFYFHNELHYVNTR